MFWDFFLSVSDFIMGVYHRLRGAGKPSERLLLILIKIQQLSVNVHNLNITLIGHFALVTGT